MPQIDPAYRNVDVVVGRVSAEHRLDRQDYNRIHIEATIARLVQQVWNEVADLGEHLVDGPTVEVVIRVEGQPWQFPAWVLEDTVENRVEFQGMVERAHAQRQDHFTFSAFGPERL